MPSQGNLTFQLSVTDNLQLAAWHDSKVTVAITNVHPPAVIQVELLKKGLADKLVLQGPLCIQEHNSEHGCYQQL